VGVGAVGAPRLGTTLQTSRAVAAACISKNEETGAEEATKNWGGAPLFLHEIKPEVDEWGGGGSTGGRPGNVGALPHQQPASTPRGAGAEVNEVPRLVHAVLKPQKRGFCDAFDVLGSRPCLSQHGGMHLELFPDLAIVALWDRKNRRAAHRGIVRSHGVCGGAVLPVFPAASLQSFFVLLYDSGFCSRRP